MVFEFHTVAEPLGECQHFFRQAVRRSRSICLSSIRHTNDHWQTVGSGSAGSVPFCRISVALCSPDPERTTGVLTVLSCVISVRRRNPNDATSLLRSCRPSRRTWFHHSCSSQWHKARPTTMQPCTYCSKQGPVEEKLMADVLPLKMRQGEIRMVPKLP